MRFKAGRVLVEQARDISRRKAGRNVASPDEREPGGRPLRVGGVEAKRRSERVRRRVDLPKPLARFAEGEPRSGPVRRALQRLFENLRRRPKIALFRRGPGVGEAAPGDEIAAGERIAPHARSALPAPQAVEIDDDDDERAGDDPLPERIEVEQVGAVVDRRQDEGADQRPLHRADRAEKAGAADDRRGDRLQFPALPWVGLPMPIRIASRMPTKAAQNAEMT